ncbi:hypothetical protein NW752_004179 [Fusarium irregulare]|uniref:Uncharacterized protein n=1 Tax=Fusarium irregulare TaxID=2494466 RepID=A0A9W8PMQ3_9HYPO|nr:hypothetical protein NW766_007078 [Fusarium irregulare]KAJ4021172.1 hypothetical protein NW752_004179 [Fusarium irregulare]
MASYYPEGECYFVRNSLRLPNGRNANNERHFYSHILIEYYWNGWVTTGNQAISHTRSQWRQGIAQGIGNNTRYNDWDRFWVGESKEKNPQRMVAMHSHPNSLNWNECRDLRGGGPRKYILRPIQIQSRETEWLWIDATIPIRAIYFPVCQRTDEAFENLCTYVVIDFRHRQNAWIMDYAGGFATLYSMTSHAGLGRNAGATWGFHVPDIIAYLSIPHKLRNPDYSLFNSKNRRNDLVVSASSRLSWTSTTRVIHHPDFFREIDLAKVLSATFGVEVGWRPYEPSRFLRDLIIRLVDTALGMVPGVGPLLSIAFGIAVQALEDPHSFSIDNILDLNQAARDEVTRSSNKHRKYLAPNFMGKGRGRQAPVPLSDDDRASRQTHGDELNEKLTKELKPQVVIRSLLEQELFMYGADSMNGVVEEEEETELETVQIEELEDEGMSGQDDENKKDE